mmetsp:Transcript_18155/g.24206  ORF Transcript_18155/g.24206 Transcript_18155/m.24206 type:complete len:88 (+) Transcript_18155:245-508(+)
MPSSYLSIRWSNKEATPYNVSTVITVSAAKTLKKVSTLRIKTPRTTLKQITFGRLKGMKCTMRVMRFACITLGTAKTFFWIFCFWRR